MEGNDDQQHIENDLGDRPDKAGHNAVHIGAVERPFQNAHDLLNQKHSDQQEQYRKNERRQLVQNGLEDLAQNAGGLLDLLTHGVHHILH